MGLDLRRVPFSRSRSYMALTEISGNIRPFGRPVLAKEGLYLKSVRGACRMTPLIGRIKPLYRGKEISYEYEACPEEMVIVTAEGTIQFCFADENTLLIRGEGEGLGLRLEELAAFGMYNYVMEFATDGKSYYIANLFKNTMKYLCRVYEGRAAVFQDWNQQTSENCSIQFEEEGGRFFISIEEIPVERKVEGRDWNYEKCKEQVRDEFDSFMEHMPSVPLEYTDVKMLASYICWSSKVRSDGFLYHDAVYPSKNWMLGAFGWDQCFIAMALAYHQPELAWEQFILMFDHQDKTGRIPDAVTDSSIVWNFVKPPIHGWTLLKMMEHMKLTAAQKELAYTCLSRWTNWWYEFRDNDGNGVCEYYHGNDSGWDNATVFKDTPAVKSPDLSAYLVLQEEALHILARELGRDQEADAWLMRSRKQMAALREYCFCGNVPVPRKTGTHEIIHCQSLLPYQILILGRRLPENMTETMVREVKTYITDFGAATEKLESPLYEADGYWRGPIWAPSTYILLDGLKQLGEKALVREIAEKYIKLIRKSGFSENFDALTGEPERDPAYVWTAAVYFLIGAEYLE